MILKNAISLIVLSTSAVVSLLTLVFSFYMLTTASDALYVSLASSIISFWLGVSSTFIRALTGDEQEVAAPVLPA